ncbi:MAG: type VI secretion system Vgr family protein [Pyrinomonadaceae bacterium]
MAITQANRMVQITTPLGEDYLLINKLTATEALSTLFNFEVELLHEEMEVGYKPTIVDVQQIIGQEVEITITQRDTTTRTFHGIVNQFSQGNRDERFSYYYATIVPAVWVLTQQHRTRIFQQMSVPDILRDVLGEFDVQYEQQGTFKARNYCVQYRETDFAFISRLMEEEGIYYYFKHGDGTHRMIIGNMSQSNLDCPSKSDVQCFLEVSDDEDWVGSIGTWRIDHRLQTGKVTLWDYNFQTPKKNYEAAQPALVNIGGNDKLEFYDYPGGYARKYDGVDKGGGDNAADLANIDEDKSKTVKTRAQELDAQYRVVSGTADCCSLTAGHRFKLLNHPQADFNTQYVLTFVTHGIEQSPAYETEEEVLRAYGNSFSCIQYTVPFRPEQVTPKPVVRGSQTAVVVGPAGEEIFTDKYGRVKVQFFWDREGQINESSSCWVRVGQSWAGNRWGMMFIPRVGMEAVVDFIEGDPDQPIITGCVYNPDMMPPYVLPDEKTKMTIKSDSSIGGQGFNEIRFEDTKGSEQVFVHGEKDVDIRNKNDRREYVGNDHHFIVHHDRREKIENEEHRIVEKDQLEKIKGSRNLKIEGEDKIAVTGDRSLKVGGDIKENSTNRFEEAGQTIYIKAGMKVVIEAGVQITIKGAGGFIDVGPSGVTIQGTMVLINSGGSAGSAAMQSPVAPLEPKIADPADDAKPGSKASLEKRSAARKEKVHRADTNKKSTGADKKSTGADKKSWIKIKMVDEAGNPAAGKRYRVTTPNGRVASGSLDKDGKAEVKGIDPGNCKVSFPDLDKDAWEDA